MLLTLDLWRNRFGVDLPEQWRGGFKSLPYSKTKALWMCLPAGLNWGRKGLKPQK